ncbi:SDR family NAD(P)-dependent oxidoreductase [Silvibacterium acidisoli]|uniref:SDR family NAD(P)-dependent oxidoreductase n=1 Tax=Acidobacteriaceae bacterium ZG23-2 TaxID=2883246 RepID=UPI00406D1B2D
MPGLSQRVAIVTGSSSGIGQSIAIHLAQQGANVVINYSRSKDGAEQTLETVRKAGVDGLIVQADVSKVDQARSLVEQAWIKFGKADVLVNNAGYEKRSDFLEVSEEDYDNVLGVNLKGPFFLTQAFAKRLSEANLPGRVINISSVHEDMAFPHFASYCASKGGLRMLMRNLAVELGPMGITVNNIAPGAIATPMNKSLLEDKPKLNALLSQIPLGRLGTPEEVAAMTAYLASEDASYVNGATLLIDGGLTRNYHEQ